LRVKRALCLQGSRLRRIAPGLLGGCVRKHWVSTHHHALLGDLYVTRTNSVLCSRLFQVQNSTCTSCCIMGLCTQVWLAGMPLNELQLSQLGWAEYTGCSHSPVVCVSVLLVGSGEGERGKGMVSHNPGAAAGGAHRGVYCARNAHSAAQQGNLSAWWHEVSHAAVYAGPMRYDIQCTTAVAAGWRCSSQQWQLPASPCMTWP
jgi:hypothetical protein